ncbi:MAG TPA: amino acid adenylation domain-containing protein, partial [Thermoanaerobaculia bacterium]
EVLLEAVVADPDLRLWDLPLLTPAERERLLVSWNATAAPFPSDKCIHQLFEDRALADPGAVAAEDERGRVTYRELDERADRLAGRLRKLGVGPDVPVGICLGRSADLAVALLAVLKAGGAYVPLDPGYPAARLRFFLEDSGAAVLLTESRLAPLVGDGSWRTLLLDGASEPPGDVPSRGTVGLDPSNLAYMLYTSGSTGRPKGVEVTHRSLVNHATAVARRFGLKPADRVLQFASLSFDVAAEEIFPTWVAGASVVFRPGEALGIQELESLIRSRGVTVANLPSGYWHEWVAELEATGRSVPPSVRLVVAGSERVLPERLEWWRKNVPAVRWMNGYGPTETTVTATLYEPAPGDAPRTSSVPIGRPIANVRAYVVDRAGGLSPTGIPGELWIGGEGVARGYRGLPDRTAEKFIADPFADAAGRLYRTGDLVRYLADGNLEFLGRLDGQVKIRGFRIEPAEVEAILSEHPAVQDAAVVAREDADETRLVAYVVSSAPAAAGSSELRAHLKARLPAYMVPSVFVAMEALPRTASGKIDRQRLPEPG